MTASMLRPWVVALCLVACFSVFACETLLAAKRPPQRNRHARKAAISKKKSPPLSPAAQRIADRQHELLSLQKSIETDRAKIASLREKERSTTEAIARYRRHSQNIQRYMALLEEEIESLQDKAATAHSASESTAGDLWRLRKRYAVIAQNMLKNDPGKADPLMVHDSRGGFIDAVAEAGAMRKLSAQARDNFKELANKRDSLSDESQKLRTKSEMRAVLLAMKDSEQKELDHTIAITQKALAAIRSDKSQVLAHLKKTQAGAAEVSRYIASMVAKESKTTSAAKATKTTSKATATTKSTGNSVTLNEKGPAPAHLHVKAKSLPYPVNSRKILRAFGPYRNAVTNTITDNPGIDIAASQGSTVNCVAAGTVSLVHWLPGYSSVVIVDHHNGFRSVYANLSSVMVKQGQQLNAQQGVGRSGESIDGEFVHLEFWFEKQRLNPLSYLK